MKIKEVFEPGPFGKPPSERSVPELLQKGVINLDKPPGPNSHQVASWVKGIVGAKKAGHAGTLDPAVSGVLPVTLDKACKVIEALLSCKKTYVGVMHLHDDVDERELEKKMSCFIGVITQLPPLRSAVKRAPREREVFSFQILEREGRDVLFRTEVEAGTYIRKLCHDLGEALGSGAHMAELRRVQSGPFNEESSFTLHELNEAWLLHENGEDGELRRIVRPVEEAVDFLPKILVKDSSVSAVCHGAPLAVNGISKLEEFEKGGTVAAFTLKGELIGIGEAQMDWQSALHAVEGVAARLHQVLLERDLYPKIWKGQE